MVEAKLFFICDAFVKWDANGDGVLDFYQAQGAARTMYEEVLRGGVPAQKDVTVQQVADRYLAWFREHRKGVAMAESAVRAHISPTLGDRRLPELTTADLRAWLDRLATKVARLRSSKASKKPNLRPIAETKDEKRARRASANRILSVLKAILNRAFQDGLVADDSAWRKVKPAVSFHELRHTYASHLAQAGVDLLTISKLLGHADTRITAKHYAHLADKTLALAVAKLPNFTAGRMRPQNLRAVR